MTYKQQEPIDISSNVALEERSFSGYINISGVRIDMVQSLDVLKVIENLVAKGKPSQYIVVTNAYDMVMNSRNKEMGRAANNSLLTVPDGISLILLGRLHGYPLKKRVYGPDLMLEFLKLAEIKGYSNFFYGSTQETLELLVEKMKMKFPGLNIKGTYSPPFRDLSHDEEANIVNVINNTCPDVLWVGLGTPKQQLWMYKQKGKLNVPIMVGVGAAFDFLAGTKLQAPRWMRDNGFEWLFRLATEPRRLWKRYLIGNSIFLWLFLKEFVKIKTLRKKSDYD